MNSLSMVVNVLKTTNHNLNILIWGNNSFANSVCIENYTLDLWDKVFLSLFHILFYHKALSLFTIFFPASKDFGSRLPNLCCKKGNKGKDIKKTGDV